MKQRDSLSQLRRHAREVALKTLYEAEMGDLSRQEAAGRVTRRLRRPEERKFALTLVNQTLENLAEIDKIIAEVAENWDLSRMAVIDKNTLRLGVAEILFCGVPAKVAINEAIEVAKKFSTENSGRFVNGILDKVARMKRALRNDI